MLPSPSAESHSGFKGGRPYHQAYDRGVKLIGATAYYVTGDLGEGPIIEQEGQRVNHTADPRTMAMLDQDVEALVLSRAVRWHCEHRVLVRGHRTIVFNWAGAHNDQDAGFVALAQKGVTDPA